MYDLKRLIRRRAVGCAGPLCLILVVASTTHCTSDSITGGETPGPDVQGPGLPSPVDPDPVETPLVVGSVTLPDSLTVAVHETAQLNAIVRDTDGAVIVDPRVVFTVTGLKAGAVNRNGLVTGLVGGCGVGTVMARSGSVNSNPAVVTIGTPSAADCRVVGSVTLSPDSLTVMLRETAQLSVIVRDTTGAVIANPEVLFYFVGQNGVGTVDSNGLVTSEVGCGDGRIRARSEGVDSNTVVVHVHSPSPDGAGCWDY